MKKHSKIRRCRVCGCTDDDCRQCIAKTGSPCYWIEPDLCSACSPARVARLTYNRREACFALGIRTSTLWRLEKCGRIRSIAGIRHKLYSIESLKRFVEGKAK